MNRRNRPRLGTFAGPLALLLSVSGCSGTPAAGGPAEGGTGGSGGSAGSNSAGGSGGGAAGGSGGRSTTDASVADTTTMDADGSSARGGVGTDGPLADAAGGFSPEQVLANPLVAAAIAQANDNGFPLLLHTEHQAPPITGYYLKPEGEGKFVATDNGDGVGNGVMGFEARITVDAGDLVTEASVSFNSGFLVNGSLEKGIVLRGANEELTLYTNYRAKCPEAAPISRWTATPSRPPSFSPTPATGFRFAVSS